MMFAGLFTVSCITTNLQTKEAQLVRRLQKKGARLDCQDIDSSQRALFIYWFSSEKLTKEHFNNDELFDFLSPVIDRRTNSQKINVVFFNLENNVIAYSEGDNVYCNYNYTHFSKIAKYYLEEEPEMIFRISGTDGNNYLVFKSKEVFVLDFGYDSLTVHTIDEFKDCCWEGFLLESEFSSNRK
jgi:hypothetical protein